MSEELEQLKCFKKIVIDFFNDDKLATNYLTRNHIFIGIHKRYFDKKNPFNDKENILLFPFATSQFNQAIENGHTIKSCKDNLNFLNREFDKYFEALKHKKILLIRNPGKWEDFYINPGLHFPEKRKTAKIEKQEYNDQNIVKPIIVAVIAGLFVFIIGNIIFNKFEDVQLFYNKTINRKNYLIKEFKKLKAGANTNLFINILGQPKITKSITIDQKEYTENIFIDSLYYVQSFSDKDSKIIYYSITTRKNSFNPEIIINSDGYPEIRILLGKNTFSDLYEDKLYPIDENENYSKFSNSKYYGNYHYVLGAHHLNGRYIGDGSLLT